MKTNPVTGPGASAIPATAPTDRKQPDFAAALRRSMSGLADIQRAADQAAQSIAVGDLAKLHEAMIAIQKASLALEFAVAVRNHVVEGVQELLHTQV